MTTNARILITGLLLMIAHSLPGHAVELKVTRDALERTLRQQLFNAPDGRYYVKGNPKSPCSVYAENPQLRFDKDRIVVKVKTHARLGKAVAGTCLGIALSPTAEVSLAPDGDGETIGFRDARIEHISGQRELDFILTYFLSHQVPSSLKVNAAELLRNALQGSTATSGYKVTLDRLKIQSITLQNDKIVVSVDGDISVK